VLLRARAIENQVYVVAPNAIGKNVETGTVNYGRSLIVDPWGNVLAQAPDQPGYITATLDMLWLKKVRQRLPTLANRRLNFSS
jgi:predicted amidohydrolase